jgi:hypothetical protein
VNAERMDIALDATYQIDAVLDTLGRIQGAPGFDLVLQAVLPRMLQLTSTIMTALNDESVELAEMRVVVDRWAGEAVQP